MVWLRPLALCTDCQMQGSAEGNSCCQNSSTHCLSPLEKQHPVLKGRAGGLSYASVLHQHRLLKQSNLRPSW